MENGLTEEEILEQIALQITKNQINYESKSEEEKKEMAQKVNIVAESKLGELKKDFNSIIGSIDATITPEIRLTVLQGISDRVMKQGINNISEVFTATEVINYVNNLVTIEEKRSQEKNNIEGIASSIYIANEINSIDTGFVNDVETGENWKFRNDQLAELFSGETGIGNVKSLSVNERKLVDVVDKNINKIDELIKQVDSDDPEKSKEAKIILSVASTVTGFRDVEKKYSECSRVEKENALNGIFNLGRIVEETGDEFSTELLESFVNTLGLDNVIKKDEAGNIKIDVDYIQDFAKKEGFSLVKRSPKIMDEEHWTWGFENFSSSTDFVESAIIQMRKKEMDSDISLVTRLVKEGDKSLEEAKEEINKSISKNIDAANRTLMSLDEQTPNTPEGKLYNYTIQSILKQYLNAPEKYKIDNYVMGDLIEGIGVLKNRGLEKLDSETLELIGKVSQKNMIMLKGSQKDVKYDENQYLDYQQIYISAKEQLKEIYKDPTIEFSEELDYDDLKKYVEQMIKDQGYENFSDFSTNLLNSKYPKKEMFVNATLDFLEEQKDTDEFSTEESEGFRQELFETIVLSGVTEPEIFEKMKALDRESSKKVLEEMIKQVNSSRIALNKVVGSLQELGKNLNEPIKENFVEDKDLGFLKVEDVSLPHVDMFGKNRNNDGSEPDDR